MQCVILCAGKGTRMRPLTDNCPKPLIPVCGKPILDHIINALPSIIDEIIIIIGYRAEQIVAHCGDTYKGREIVYRTQENFAGGTGDALMCAKGVLRGKFLFLNGDDVQGKDTLKKAVVLDHVVLGFHSDTPERYGVLVPNTDGTLKGIIEKPKNPPSNLINTGGYVLNDSIFNYQVPLSVSGELYMTDMVTEYAKDNPVQILEQDVWIPIGYPEDIEKAERILSENCLTG